MKLICMLCCLLLSSCMPKYTDAEMEPSAYKRINEAFVECLEFVPEPYGFGSTFNNLLNAAIYARANNKRFVLNTEQWNYRFSEGFVDYFEPLAEKSALKPGQCLNNTVVKDHSEKNFKNVNLLAGLSEPIKFEDLNLLGSIEQVKRAFALAFWRIKPEVGRKIDEKVKALGLGGHFQVLQIRRGDKSMEADPVEVSTYLRKLTEVAPNNNMPIFVMTDDCEIYEEVKKSITDVPVKSLCVPGDKGHDQPSFNALSPQLKYEAMLQLLTEIEIARNSDFFIGTFSSNIPRLVYLLHKNRKNMIGVEPNMPGWHYR